MLITGCVSNSRYTKPDAKLEEQIKDYPRNEEEIRKYKREFENYQAYKNITENIGYRYQILPAEKTKWSIGDPDALLHIGHTEYKYQHKISLLIICGEHTFAAKRFKDRSVNWKISGQLGGLVTTSSSGEVKITFTNDIETRYDKIRITTSKNTYVLSLGGHLLLEINSDECD